MRKNWHDRAWEEYVAWQTQDKKTLKKINKLLRDIDRKANLKSLRAIVDVWTITRKSM